MGSNLSFSAGLQKLGNNYLSIEDATLNLQTSFQFGVGTVVTGLSFSGGELHLPIGDPITMPSFSINLDGIGNIYSFNLGSIVPNYTATNSTTFEVELKSNGVVEFRLKDNATFSLNAFGNSMTVNHLKVTTSNYFDADVTGSLSLAVGNNTYTILNTTFNMWTYNNSLRLNLSSNGGTIDNLPAVGDVSISGNFYSSSDFYFSGSYSPSWMSATVKIDENGLRLYGNFLGDGYRNFTLHSDGIVEGTFQGSTKKFFLTGSKTNSVNFVLRPVTTIANLMGNSVSSTLESYFGNATSFFYNLSAFASNLSKQSTYQFNQFINAVADAFGWDVG